MGTAYQRVADALRAEISEGRWVPGQRLPGEHDLMRQFSVSRNTIRQALDLLSNANVVRRQQGRGTFVAEQGISHVLGDLRSFTEVMVGLGLTPGICDVTVALDPTPPEEARAFLPGAHLWLIQRVRTSDGRPFSLMQSWLPDAVAAAVKPDELEERQSLYALLHEKRGIQPSEATEVIRAEAASEEDAAALHIPVGSPLLTIYRWTTENRGQPIEYVRSTSPGDRYQYVIKLHQ